MVIECEVEEETGFGETRQELGESERRILEEGVEILILDIVQHEEILRYLLEDVA